MALTPQRVEQFQREIWDYYRSHGRAMPWRDDPSPYKVIVSELMLQQTQVARVIPKFEAFIQTFPDISSLAGAPLSEVLSLWSGLGYNRRAKYLHETARIVASHHSGIVPDSYRSLLSLPGIGPNTAGAVLAYAYQQPVVFIETNIRTVYFHHFYSDSQEAVSDNELRELVGVTIDNEHPRQWYWALMDYGAFLKKTAGGRLNQSKHYKKQSPLAGSLREMRGRIVTQLVDGPQSDMQLLLYVNADDRYQTARDALCREGIIEQKDNRWRLTGAV